MDEGAEIPEFLKRKTTQALRKPPEVQPKPRHHQKPKPRPGVVRKAVGIGAAAGAVTFGASILGSIRPADNPTIDTQDTKPGMTQTLAKSPHDQTPIYYDSFDKENIFDKVFHNPTLQEREQAQKIVREMEEVISGNPSYNDMLVIVSKHKNLIRETAKKYGVPENMALGIVLIENGGGEDMTSPASARGIAQLMPETARRYKLKVGGEIDDRADPVKSIDVMARYLVDLYKRFGDWGIAAWGYHAGEGNVYNALRVYFQDTQGVDLGDIITDNYEEAERLKVAYKNAVAENRLNIQKLMSNRAVQEKVLSKLEDETNLYTPKIVAGANLYQREQSKTQIATVPIP